jgi:DDE superfamily endonuclease/Tc5 transposase DNA-binding domain/helix-turn-helix, Psq domain
MKYRNHSKEAISQAVEEVKNGTISIRAASKKYSIPRITIADKVKGRTTVQARSGPPSVLSEDEERLLERWIIDVSKKGFPVTKEQLLESVALYVKKTGREMPFTDGKPGLHWYQSFLKRHPNVRERLSQNLTAGRSKVTEEKLRNWFQEVNEYLVGINDEPSRVFNADETAFFLSPKGKKVLAQKGAKTVYTSVDGDEKECLTVLFTGNAVGNVAPPMVVYTFQRVPKHIIDKMPEGWAVGKTEKGWMTSESFFEYVSNVFHPWVLKNNIQLPVVLFVDGHKSHLTMSLSRFCEENGIILVALYPNATHILQPLDIGVFHPLKEAWKKKLHEWRTANSSKKFSKEYFAPLLNEVIFSTITKEMMTNSFRATGLCPFDPNAVDYGRLLLPARKDPADSLNASCTISDDGASGQKHCDLANASSALKYLYREVYFPGRYKHLPRMCQKRRGRIFRKSRR